MTGKHPSFSISCLKIFFDLQMVTSATPNLTHYQILKLYGVRDVIGNSIKKHVLCRLPIRLHLLMEWKYLH